MQDSTKVAITRLLCGTALLIVHGVTGVNGTFELISLFLLGVPVEMIEAVKK